MRRGLDSVLLDEVFEASLLRLNPHLPESARAEVMGRVRSLGGSDIMTHNETFHRMMTEGVTVEHFSEGQTRGLSVRLVDFDHPTDNSFIAVNQFAIHENNNDKRLDVVIFVNGLPLVVIELKNPTDEKATLDRAFTQIQNYQTAVPTIFAYNALCIISDGIDARAGSVSAPFSRYLVWKSPEKSEKDAVTPELQTLTECMLDQTTLLRLIRYCTVFEKEEVKDEKTGLLSVVSIKKVAVYHQYYMVEKAVCETLRATHEVGDRKVGVVWHTQGSGKSLSMVFYAGRLVVEPEMKNPTIVILTDRNDLDDQLFQTFTSCTSLLRQTPIQATSREHLKELLRVS